MQVASTNYSANEVIRVSDLRNTEASTHGDIAKAADHTLYVALDFAHYGMESKNSPPKSSDKLG